MTEYWKSQARKYCEFCKCWYADNKVSISFHENGKRHKENVQKHISQLSKRSAKDMKHKEKLDDDMKKMEAAAMAAYLKDVQNNADLTSKSINEMLEQSGSKASDISVSKVNVDRSSSKTPAWQEVRGDDGSSYYWNTETNETTWDPPDEYVSIAQQEQQKLREKGQEKKQDKIKKQKHKEALKEAKAHIARESMRALAAPDERGVSASALAPLAPPAAPASVSGPAPRAADPYGTWKAVITQPEEKVDLQLPKADKELPPPPVVVEPEVIQFKEKRVESLGTGPVEFKKRKLNNARRNMRQKLDDD